MAVPHVILCQSKTAQTLPICVYPPFIHAQKRAFFKSRNVEVSVVCFPLLVSLVPLLTTYCALHWHQVFPTFN